MESKLKRIGERASKDPRERFTSIYHHVYARENLRASFEAMEEDKADFPESMESARRRTDGSWRRTFRICRDVWPGWGIDPGR